MNHSHTLPSHNKPCVHILHASFLTRLHSHNDNAIDIRLLCVWLHSYNFFLLAFGECHCRIIRAQGGGELGNEASIILLSNILSLTTTHRIHAYTLHTVMFLENEYSRLNENSTTLPYLQSLPHCTTSLNYI